MVTLFSNSNSPPRFRTSLTGNHEEEEERLRRWQDRYRVSYAHRESPSRETGASVSPFINESTAKVENEERECNMIKKEEEKRQTIHREEDRK